MKKSDITVSMPMTTYDELSSYREKYTELTKHLANCFDDSLLKAGASKSVDFDASLALKICRAFLPYKLADTDIEIKI